MESRAEPQCQDNLQQIAKRRTEELLELAARRFKAELEMPKIQFDLRGTCAGQARTGDGQHYLIRYNPHLMERHPRQYLSQTIPHETAHVVAFSLFGSRIPPHGQEWRAIMAIFGASPQRCHSYDVEGLQERRLRRFEYRCSCRTHRLTSIRHNRVRSGQVYLCRQCGQPLERVVSQTID